MNRNKEHRPNVAADEGGRPVGGAAEGVALCSLFLLIYLLDYEYLWIFLIYIPYIFHIYFLNMFHIFSLVCFLTYGVNIPVRVSALMRSRSAFFFGAKECRRLRPRVRVDRFP